MQQTTQPRADLNDLFRSIDGTVIDVEGTRDTAFIESGLEGHDQRIHVFLNEELPVSTKPTGIVNESDQAGLLGSAAVFEERSEQGVSLPHVVGVRFGESEAMFVGTSFLRLEHLVLFDEPAEGVACDLGTGEPA